MITIHERKAIDFNNHGIGVLHEAFNVAIESEINGNSMLTFNYPAMSEKYEYIKLDRIVQCEGQLFRIEQILQDNNGVVTSEIIALPIYRDYEKIHVQYFGNMMGKSPRDILEAVFDKFGLKENIMTEAEANALGCTWVTDMIDFWEMSKTDLKTVLMTVVQLTGNGELLIDNKKVAIVERIGKDNGVRFDTAKNLKSLNHEIVCTDMITRLYPYGKNGLHIGKVNGGKQYIESPNKEIYGIKEGFVDYSDIVKPALLKARAELDFNMINGKQIEGEGNYYRIDEPSVNIICKVVDLWKLEEYGDFEKISLGDTVHVFDEATGLHDLKLRIVKMKYYPFEPTNSEVQVGKKRDDILRVFIQMCRDVDKYNKVSNTNGDVETEYLEGIINTNENNIQSDEGYLSVVNDLLTIKDRTDKTRAELGNVGDNFVFTLYDSSENKTIHLDGDTGDVILSGSIDTAKDCVIQGELRVGLAGNGLKGIEFYGDSYYKQSEMYAKIVPWVDKNNDYVKGINVTDGVLWSQGYFVATENDIKGLERVISDLQARVAALEKK